MPPTERTTLTEPPSVPLAGDRRMVLIAVAVVTLVGFAARLWDLDRRGFCHPENFVSGIAVPDWVKLPPERLTFADIIRTTPKDGHPPLYFLLLHPWVRAFGTSLFSLRLPSVILGTASILLLYVIARRSAGRWTAWLAAALLALNGHHVFWSQMARMYAPATFLVLLSTWLLLRLHERDGLGRRWAYGLVTAAALWTHIYCWPVILGQMLWEVARAVHGTGRARALGVQFAALIVGLPVAALALYQSPKTDWAEPVLEFFEFGYLFYSGANRFGPAPLSPLPHLALLLGGIGLVLAGLIARPAGGVVIAPTDAARPTPRVPLLALGAVISATIAWAALSWFVPGQKRRLICFAVAVLPLALAAALPLIERWITALNARRTGLIPAFTARLQRIAPLLALTPIACFALVSLGRPAFTARGMLVAVPFLAIVLAEGVAFVGRRKILGIALAAALLALHVVSVGWFHENEAGPRDYATFSRGLDARLKPTDLVFVGNTYVDPPLLYYLPTRHQQFVPTDYAAAVARSPGARAWVILYDDQVIAPEMTSALAGFERQGSIDACNCHAELFVRR